MDLERATSIFIITSTIAKYKGHVEELSEQNNLYTCRKKNVII